ncbi:hypothetical protein K402DRAFT_403455 [Aulographum hederae CBS 113979]|uniref:Transcription factor domain-containing protein n=1 Tax=Aulographum hederae CBS 113979 TaxID=1176131 RepID=A0A6G1H458_9PEZI|nr:hypothetical protein K402DRAFT_403455 [Aulographum hederae CBS 113979]
MKRAGTVLDTANWVLTGRRRKIRCIFSSDSSTTCTECFARGSRCIDQEHAESDAIVDQRKNLRERVARLESLVDTLLEDRTDRGAAEALSNLGRTPAPFPPTPLSDDTPSGAAVAHSHAPLLSLFNNDILSRAENHTGSTTTPGAIRTPAQSPNDAQSSFKTAVGGDAIAASIEARIDLAMKAKNDQTRQALISALPPYDQMMDMLRKNTHWWGIFRKKCPGTIGRYTTLEQFASRVIAQGTPPELGTLLLAVGSCTEGDLLERYLGLVNRWIVSDDDYLGSLEGLECVILQGKCYSDIGQARRGWLTFRRGLVFAQLLGLHRNHEKTPEGASIWWNLFGADRFASLMLGMPYGIGEAHCSLEFGTDAWYCFFVKVGILAGRVIDRTQNPQEQSFSSALDLDQEIEDAGNAMPNEFWTTINQSPQMTDVDAATEWQELILSQICFYQLRVYLHMPFMLKSAVNPRFEYSRKTCLDNARKMLQLYHLIRSDGTPMYQCKAIDFIGFTGCILIALGLMGYGRLTPGHNLDQDEEDWRLIDTSIEIFKRASTEKGGKVASQSYQVLEQMRLAKDMDPNIDCASANCTTKFVIPYFGTISVKPGRRWQQSSISGSSGPSSQMPTPSSSTSANTVPSKFTAPPEQAANTWSSMDPFIAYDGFYMNSSPDQQQPQQQQTTEPAMQHYGIPTANDAFPFPNIASMDIDQDWSWFNDAMAQQPPGQPGFALPQFAS